MSELLRRFRYGLSYFGLASLCALAMASQHSPHELGFAPRLVLNLTLPLERMVTMPLGELRGVWGDYVALVGVREDNERLRGRLARAEEENHQYREAILSSERFQKLSGFRAQREIPMVPANVIHQDLSAWFQSLIIDQGAAAGIRPGMPVITDSGVVGLVSGTTPGASKVLLIVDPQSRVDAYVERTRARGTVRGTSSHQADFEYVLRQENIEEGDLLLTSGLGTVYPKGLVVGRVATVDRKTSGLFLSAKISPAVDFTRLEEVFVILEQRQIPDEEAFSAADDGLWPAAPKKAPEDRSRSPATAAEADRAGEAQAEAGAGRGSGCASPPRPRRPGWRPSRARSRPRGAAGMSALLRLVGVGIALLLAQALARLVLPAVAQPDLVLVYALALGLRGGGLQGLLLAFGAGFVEDVLSGSPPGLFALLCGTACAATRLLDRALYLRAAGPWATYVGVYALLNFALCGFALRMFAPAAALPWDLLARARARLGAAHARCARRRS